MNHCAIVTLKHIFVSATLLLLAMSPVGSLPSYNSFDRFREVQLEGLRVTMVLQKRGPTVEQGDWPNEPIRLAAQSVKPSGKTIHEILKDNHIFPDVEAFMVVYALNPDLKELRQLTTQRVSIPKVIGGAKLEEAFKNGFVVLLTVEKERKQRFTASVEMWKRLVNDFSKFGPERFHDAAARELIMSSLNTTSALLSGINMRIVQRFGRPISTEGLNQLTAEVELVNRMLSAKSATAAKFDQSDQSIVSAVEKDVRIKGKAFIEIAAGEAPPRFPEVDVVVKTLRDGSQIPNLRIYYVAEALKNQDGEVQPFGILSSPSNKKIPEADYCFWAARDPSKTAVTNVLCLEIRTNRQSEVQLTVSN